MPHPRLRLLGGFPLRNGRKDPKVFGFYVPPATQDPPGLWSYPGFGDFDSPG